MIPVSDDTNDGSTKRISLASNDTNDGSIKGKLPTNFIGWLKEQEEETVKNKKKVKTTHNQVAIENQQSVQNASKIMDTQKNDQNSRNSLFLSEKDMEIDGFDDNQSGIEEEAVADSREGQMLYSEAVKKSLPKHE
ncbi:20711_t:CDS:2 [Gigaspora margarita]|uniref:20711_t:CDS:1 n=1 Tax=Gigaspora margarita TaxID=4874 RepID=A0ABN7UWT6_GIGMA|nr:20711_t:CDS:2 [Gigaspora margarita]